MSVFNKFSTRLKISWFCQISSFAGQDWSNSWFQAKFSTRLRISGFCQVSSFAGPKWSKISFLSQISTQIKIFLDFVKFILCWFGVVKTLIIWAKFSTQLKISGFCQISSFACPECSKLSNFVSIFSTTKNFWRLSFLFQHDSKFPDFAKFHPLLVRSGQNSHNLSQIFNATENFWILPNFILCWFGVVKTLIIWAKFSMRLNISGFCQISAFLGPEWSKKVNFDPNFKQ